MVLGAGKILVIALIMLTLTSLAPGHADGAVTGDALRFTSGSIDRFPSLQGEPYSDLSPLTDESVAVEGPNYTLEVSFRFALSNIAESEKCDAASVDLRKMGTNSFLTVQSGHTDDEGRIVFNNVGLGTYIVRIQTDDDRWVRVADGSKVFDPNYYWNTEQFSVSADRTLDYLISDQTRGAWAIYRNLREGAGWLWDRTDWQRSQVTVVWPEGDWPHSHGDVIHMPSESDVPGTIWMKDISLHEYAHCVHYELRGGSFPDGDGPEPHYIDSESSSGFAFREGWAQFFESAVENDPERSDGSSLESTVFADGPFGNGDDGDMDGAEVEGAVASLLWDLYDGVDPQDRIVGNDRGDNIDGQFGVLWDIMYRDNPDSVNDIKRAWPVRDVDVLAIFHNARIPMELDPPSNPSSFRSSHELGIGSIDSTIYLRWLGARDDGSGVRGYSILINDLPHSIPDQVLDLREDSLTTASLTQGTYYVHIRTVDQDGNWAEDVYSIGPFLISDGATPLDEPLIPEGNTFNALIGLVVVVGVVSMGLLLLLFLDRKKKSPAPPVMNMRLANCPFCGRPDQGGGFCPNCGGRLR